MKPSTVFSYFIVAFFLIGTSTLPSNKLHAAFVNNMPVARLQPNGDTLHCFATGDEFYHRLHDADNYTIIQNHANGWYVYANRQWNPYLDEWSLVPTTLIPGHDNPASFGISVGLVEARSIVEAKHKQWQVPQELVPESLLQRDRTTKDNNHGRLNNIVIFIRFADDSAITTPYSTIHDMFNDSTADAISLHNYFWRASYGKIRIPTYFFPTPDNNNILSYQDSLPRCRFMPYDATTNPTGYNGSNERADMEFGLLQRAVNYVNQNYPVPNDINIDYNNDGLVDNICFIVKGTYTGWSDLLWPHKWSLYDRYVYLNGKRVYTFNLQLEGSGSHYFSTSTFCHEMFHTLGAPDLYHYNNYTNVTGVGIWDLMCNNTTPPQHMSIYMKMRYGQWIDSVPEITDAGTYSLHSVGDSIPYNNCYRINAGNPSQWYYIEYRDNTELFETGLPGSGLVIFRTDSRFNGNANFDGTQYFDEVYVFRPDAVNDTTNGTVAQAFFSNESGRTTFTPSSNPFPWLTGNEIDTTLYITNIGTAGDSITFTYTPHRPAISPCDSNCLITVTMQDQYGDTWNGAYLSFEKSNGEILANLSIGDCKTTEIRTIPVCDDFITVRWHSGSYDNECSYSIRLADNSIWRSESSPSSGLIGTITNPCGGPEETYTVTVQSNDTNNYVAGSGDYTIGSTVRIHAYTNNHYQFLGWHDGHSADNTIHSTEPHRDITVMSDSLFTAIFQRESYTVNATAAEGCDEMGYVTGVGSFYFGDTVTLTAEPYDGFLFDHWTYAHTQTSFYDNPLIFVIDRSANYWAWFKPANGVDRPTTDDISITTQHNTIIVNGVTGKNIEIYDILGRLVTRSAQDANSHLFTVPTKGVYIVRIEGRQSEKIVVM